MSTSTNNSFSEADIRPSEFMAKETELFEEGIRQLMTKKDQFVHVPCPACGADDAQEEFQKSSQRYVKCEQCETVYINPRPSIQLLSEYYSTSVYYDYWNDYIFPKSEQIRREKIFKPRVQRLARILRRLDLKPKTLLEVGAGFGTFCKEIEELNIFERILAVEPTAKLAQSCRERGLEVFQQNVEELTIDHNEIDVIVSFEVIEHLFSPSDFIAHCGRLLSPGGLLVLTCPNIKGFDIEVLQNLSDSIDPEHLNYFHSDSLSLLVELNGFKVIEIQTPGKLDAELVRKKVLSDQYDLSGQPFLKRVLIEQWDELGQPFQEFLAANKLSSHLWLAAIKL